MTEVASAAPVGDHYQTLLEVSESIAVHRDLPALFRDLALRLPRVAPFDFIGLVLHNPDNGKMKIHVIETSAAPGLAGRLDGLELPMEESASGWVWTHQEPLVIPDLSQERRFSMGMAALRDIAVESVCLFPLTTPARRLGVIGLGSLKPEAFGARELEFLKLMARQVAVAVENVLNYGEARAAQEQLRYERDRLRLLLEVNNAVVSHLDLAHVFTAVSACLRKVIQHDGSSLLLSDSETNQWRIHVLDFATNESFIEEGREDMPTQSPCSAAIAKREPALFREADLKAMSADSEIARRLLARGVKSFCSLPLLSHNRVLGALNIGRRRDDGFAAEDVELLSQVAQQVAIAVENALAYKEIAQLKNRLAEEKLYLEREIQTDYNFEEIVGESRPLRQVLKEVQTVAPTDSTVLILGETGSGKELVARALHNLSERRARTFVKLNCAAIPTGLLESELFGHERGAFTGAIGTKIGRFELADHGTIFLDEVGEIPLELQVKLLRVLQEQEFERLGGTKTIRVDVRVVAATHRDLARMIEEQTFRADLYYRLNVFPITVPPLRDRMEDIPPLVRHFAQKFAVRMKKPIESIPADAMKALQAYPWPGNVRELENFIERAVILTQGHALFVPLTELKRPPNGINAASTSLEQAERDHILRALRESDWVIGGRDGAAARLDMKRTTLQSKMQKLGITRPR
ncbi:MAG TPA: sigma 54-interacting transcriptional regulator [Nitrospiraceae bacterium]|nr:sigma 54-interacting transcriptional regulator [Nitrospiraceae bacterium]